jgi:hypothetical protein
VNTNQGFGTDLSSGGQHGGLLTMEPQIGTSFSTSTLGGNYIYSNDTLIVTEMSGGIGGATFASGNATPTGDTSDSDGTLFLNTAQGTSAYTVDPPPVFSLREKRRHYWLHRLAFRGGLH